MRAQDLEVLAPALRRAFVDDPMMRFIFADRVVEPGPLTWFMGGGVRYGRQWGEVFVAGDPPVGASVWLRPGEGEVTQEKLALAGFDAAPEAMGDGAFERFGRLMALFGALHARLIEEPHWYLMILGVDPAVWRRGWGGALLKPILQRADEAGLACYLETCAPDNLPFYRRHGFEVAAEEGLSDGPRGWAMIRQPRGSAVRGIS